MPAVTRRDSPKHVAGWPPRHTPGPRPRGGECHGASVRGSDARLLISSSLPSPSSTADPRRCRPSREQPPMLGPPPVPASWMPSPPEAQDAPSASVTAGTGDNTRLQPPRPHVPRRPAGESRPPAPSIHPLPQYQPLNGFNGPDWGQAGPRPPDGGGRIVPSRNLIAAGKQSPEKGGWQEV